MSTRYRILAYSAQLNQDQQSFDLQNDSQLENPAYAQQHADGLAQRLNRQIFAGAADWRGRIEAYDHRP